MHHRGGGARDIQCMRFRTFGHSEFKFYYDLFYPAHCYRGRKKRVPESISELLTARALAYWFMDDGSYKFNKSKNGKRYYVFNTQSFILEDQSRLVQALIHNF